MDELTAALRANGALTEEQARRITELETRTHLPLARELHAFLYLGAALILAGVGATVKDHLLQLGPMTILAALGLSSAACFAYCARRVPPFAAGKVEAPTAAFDYILYLGCGLLGVFFTYLEAKFSPLGSWWDMYLFASGLLCVGLAYRFDNRLVLATGLVNLAGWLGYRVGRFDFGFTAAKPALIAYGAVLVGLGIAARKGRFKSHFQDTYLSLGVHLALASLLFDATKLDNPQYWVLVAACAALGWWSLSEKRFDTFAAAVGYAYVASLIAFMAAIGANGDLCLWIVLLSSAAVIAVLLWARAHFKEAAA